MSRLRVRIELNRRMAGVPLDKMASVVEETRKFFYLLSEDVHIEADRGEWLASDFDAESLNFTAEYGSPVSPNKRRPSGRLFPAPRRCAASPSRSSRASPIFWVKTSWLVSGCTNPIRRPSPPNGAASPSAMPCASAKRSSCWPWPPESRCRKHSCRP